MNEFRYKKLLLIFIMNLVILTGCLTGCSINMKKEQTVSVDYKYDNMYQKSILKLDTELEKPRGIIYKNNMLYVSDTGNDRILKIDLNGNIKQEINLDGGLSEPKALAINDEFLCVYDKGNNRIVLLDKAGKYVDEINLLQWFGERMDIIDIEISTNNEIYISILGMLDDTKKSGIYKIDNNDAKLIKKLSVGIFGKTENGQIYFISKYEYENKNEWKNGYSEIILIDEGKPNTLMAFDNMSAVDMAIFDDNIYIFDNVREDVNMFSLDGEYIKTVYEEEENLKNPIRQTGFCSDTQGNFFFTDENSNNIYKLSKPE